MPFVSLLVKPIGYFVMVLITGISFRTRGTETVEALTIVVEDGLKGSFGEQGLGPGAQHFYMECNYSEPTGWASEVSAEEL